MIAQALSISRPAAFEPQCKLPNEWFLNAGTFSSVGEMKAFGRVSGIASRLLSDEDEGQMARRAISAVQAEHGLDLRKCVGLVVASSSMSYDHSDHQDFELNRALPHEELFAKWPSVTPLAHELKDFINPGIAADMVYGINWGCSAYTRAIRICMDMGSRRTLGAKEFFLLVTTNRLSARMDYADRVAAVFGDCATATILRPSGYVDPDRTLSLLAARASVRNVGRVAFTCEDKKDGVLAPGIDGAVIKGPGRVCIQMDGQVVRDNAPDTLFDQATAALSELELPKDRVGYWLPHEASREVTNRFNARLKEAEIHGEACHDIQEVGNLSASSIPWQLHRRWNDLAGVILTPSVGAGVPGREVMSRGWAAFEKKN